MTRCTLLTLTVLAVPALVSAADDKDLQGTWTVVKAEQNGKPLAEFLKAKLTFGEGGKLAIKLTDETQTREVAVKLDLAKKPKQIDLTHKDGDQTSTAKGIYELDGAKLKLCVVEPSGGERPTEFKSANRKVTCLELTRDKKP